MDYLSCTGLKATKHNAGNHSPFSGKIVRSRLCGIHMRIGMGAFKIVVGNGIKQRRGKGEDKVMWKGFKMEGIQGMRREVWILEDR